MFLSPSPSPSRHDSRLVRLIPVPIVLSLQNKNMLLLLNLLLTNVWIARLDFISANHVEDLGPLIFSESRYTGVGRTRRPISAPLITRHKVKNGCETSSSFRASQASYLRLETMNQERWEIPKSPSRGNSDSACFLVFELKHPSQTFQETLTRALEYPPVPVASVHFQVHSRQS